MPAAAEFVFGFEPFTITQPANGFVADGGLTGFAEADVHRAVALRVDDAFRAIDTGDSATTVPIAIHLGPASPGLSGNRYNVALGRSASPTWALLGMATTGANDRYGAAVFLDNIDTLPLVYDTADGSLNSIAGVASHEIGHLLGIAGHAAAGNAEPYPLMAIETTGLPTAARLTPREFSPDSQQVLRNLSGAVSRADFNLDGQVDDADVAVLTDNFGRSDALWQESDSSGDHVVDGLDLLDLTGAWTGVPGPSVAGSATARYDPATGAISVSVENVLGWLLVSDALMTGSADAAVVLGLTADTLVTDNADRVGEGRFLTPFGYNHLDLGPVAQDGHNASEFTLLYTTALGEPHQVGTVLAAPEPNTTLMIAAGLALLLLRRWRNQRRL
ncbi:MAG: PEP-CTERM sorting domain-containing protein [Candidatus Nealsonbacteria bacterium]|nr:PEP-CTERM sorting domain-containing protein [Candidatus Nealsonbacteria bacterium]